MSVRAVPKRYGAGIPDQKDSGILDQLVWLSAGHKVDLTSDRITKVDLSTDHVCKRRRVRVWAKRQESEQRGAGS